MSPQDTSFRIMDDMPIALLELISESWRPNQKFRRTCLDTCNMCSFIRHPSADADGHSPVRERASESESDIALFAATPNE